MNLLDKNEITEIGNKLYGTVGKASEGTTPEDARKIARDGTKEFHEYIKQFGINVNYIFGEETIKKYPEIVEAIQQYIDTGKISDILPLLWLGNHQSFGLEAMGLYDYFPTNGRALLKDELLLPPYFGKGIEAIDPIVYYRRLAKYNPKELILFFLKKITLDKKWLISRKQRENEIQKTILEKKAILIYPEGTRSKTGKLLKFREGLYKPAFDILSKEAEGFSNKIALITSDTHNIFPTTLEKVLLRKGKIYSGEVNLQIDIIDIEIGENIKDFNKKVYNIIEGNLNQKNSN